MSIHLLEGQEYTETHRFDIMRNLARDGAFHLAVSCKLFIISQLCGHVKNLCLALFEMHICSVLRSGLGGHQAVAHCLAQAKTAWLGARVPAQASAFSILFQNFIKKTKIGPSRRQAAQLRPTSTQRFFVTLYTSMLQTHCYLFAFMYI